MRSSVRLVSCTAVVILVSAALWLADAQQGLVAYWPFDSMAGDTFKDNTGHGYNAIWTGSGVGLAPGIVGNAVSCPDTGFDISVANSATNFVMNHFSIEAWVSADTILTGSQQKILDFGSVTTGIRNGYSFCLNAGRPDLTASSFDGSTWIDDIAPAVIQTKTWYHLAGTFDSSTLRIYVDGVLQDTASALGGIRPPGANANIGCQKRPNGSLLNFFGGKIDELKVYNYTLPADSVAAHYSLYAPTPAPPSLASPSNGAINQPTSLAVSWGAASGAASYSLQVSAASGFSTTVIQETGLATLSSTISGLASGTMYYWRVNATNAAGTSNWSGVWSFTTVPPVPDMPVLESPANGAGNQQTALNLIWGASGRATSYAVQIATSSNFSSTTVNQTGLTATTTAASGLSANATYFWRVNATDAGGTSAWSAIWSFSTILVAPNVPALLSPASGTTNQPIASTLFWNAASGATAYSLQVSSTSSFSTTAVNQSGITGVSSPIAGLANSTTYYWRVNASGAGGTSAWSSVWNFLTVAEGAPSVPGLSSPANGAANQPLTVNLFWGAAAGAASYTLQVSTASTFATTASNQTGLTGTSGNVTGLAVGTPYYWHVNAMNAGGTTAWSSVWSFTTVPQVPAAPTLVSPSNGAIFENPCYPGCAFPPVPLVWDSVTGATTYTVQLSKDSTFASSVFTQNGAMSPDTIPDSALEQRAPVVYWRVNAGNAGGTGKWSVVRYFNVHFLDAVLPLDATKIETCVVTFGHGTLYYSLKDQSPVEITLFDILGKKALDLSFLQSPGSYRLPLSKTGLSQGRYMLRFNAAGLSRDLPITITR